jgi:tRNA(Phe) wybutosine-synthesizing methylase Tyw3
VIIDRGGVDEKVIRELSAAEPPQQHVEKSKCSVRIAILEKRINSMALKDGWVRRRLIRIKKLADNNTKPCDIACACDMRR